MNDHKNGTREEWLAARLELLEAEKELTRRSDEVARRRRELPRVRIDKKYRFDPRAAPAASARVRRYAASAPSRPRATAAGPQATLHVFRFCVRSLFSPSWV